MRARSFQPRVTTVERVDRLTEQGRSTVTAGHDTSGTQCDAECARGAERPGKLELLFCQTFRRLVIAERELGEGGHRSPGEVARAGDRRARQKRANGQEVLEPFGQASLCNPKSAAGEANLCGDH